MKNRFSPKSYSGVFKQERFKEKKQRAIFLASEAASYMVGSTVTVDGGWMAQ